MHPHHAHGHHALSKPGSTCPEHAHCGPVHEKYKVFHNRTFSPSPRIIAIVNIPHFNTEH